MLRWRRGPALSLAAGLLGFFVGAPAVAQISGNLSVQSDYRVRGYTISGDRPSAILGLSYDDASGFYVNGSAAGSLYRGGTPVLLGTIANVGYARRIAPRISIDAGYSRTQFFHDVGTSGGQAHYDEIYAGIAAHGLSARLSYSPDYYHSETSTLYGEVEGAIRMPAKLRLSGHVGVLGYVSAPGNFDRHSQYDWRVGLSRPIGRFDLHVSLNGGGPGEDTQHDRNHGKTAVVGGVSWFF